MAYVASTVHVKVLFILSNLDGLIHLESRVIIEHVVQNFNVYPLAVSFSTTGVGLD